MALDLEERKLRNKQKQARIDAEAARIAAAERKFEDRRKIIVGATILNAMKDDAELASRVRVYLKMAVTRENDQKHILDLLEANRMSERPVAPTGENRGA